MKNQPAHNSGFTLIELMITIVIAAILVSIAIPSFTETIAANRLATIANELVSALNLARSEAIKRGVQVTVIKNDGPATHWESGWDVFVDFDANNAFNDDEDATLCEAGEDCLLRTYDALPNGYTLRTGNSAYKNYAAYTSSGVSKSVVGDTFRLCDGSGASVQGRTISINATGRPKVATAPAEACP